MGHNGHYTSCPVWVSGKSCFALPFSERRKSLNIKAFLLFWLLPKGVQNTACSPVSFCRLTNLDFQSDGRYSFVFSSA